LSCSSPPSVFRAAAASTRRCSPFAFPCFAPSTWPPRRRSRSSFWPFSGNPWGSWASSLIGVAASFAESGFSHERENPYRRRYCIIRPGSTASPVRTAGPKDSDLAPRISIYWIDSAQRRSKTAAVPPGEAETSIRCAPSFTTFPRRRRKAFS